MDLRPALPGHPAPPASPWSEAKAARARIEAQLDLLERLGEVGTQIAEAMGRQVTASLAAPLAAPPARRFQGDVALGFSRVARAVRLTIALHAKLLVELVEWDRRADRPAAAQAAAATAAAEIAPETEPQEAAETVERLGGAESGREREREARDDIHALLARPFDEVVELIRRDLGLSPEWVAQAQAEAARDQAGGYAVEMEFADGPGRERPGPRPMKPPPRWPRPPPA